MPPPAREDLERLYHGECLGSGEIAARLGVKRHTVQNWMKRYGIPARSLSEAARLRETRPEIIALRAIQLAEAQKKITPEGRKRQSEKVSGPRDPWSDEARTSHMKYRSTPEYRKKLSKAQRGEKGHRWQGGITPSLAAQLNTWEWRQRRAECYERDVWVCQECGCHCLNGRQAKANPKRRIQCHHIVRRRDGGGDELSNLVTLCLSCHHKREAKGAAALFA